MKLKLPLFLLLVISLSCKKEVIQYTLITAIDPINSGTVTPSSGTFENGQKVNITATPSPEYLFKEWKGDLSGNLNPENILFSSNKSITASFEKRQYPLSLTIIGNGVVNEEIVPIKLNSNYPSGTTVKLTAVPSQGFQFKEWRGDASGKELSLTIQVSSAKNITAEFIETPVVIPQISGFSAINKTSSNYIDLNESKSTYFDFNLYSKFIDNPNEKISSAFNYFDFDKDGDTDFVFATTQYSETRQNVYILENKGNGNFGLWKKLTGFYWPRKSILNDFDGNGYLDFLVADQGFENPSKNYYPGAELGIIYFYKDNAEFKLISNVKEYNHSAISGDLDNDGDIDIMTLSAKYINNGNGSFAKSSLFFESQSNKSVLTGLPYYHSAMADFDNDGKLDALYGHAEIFGDSLYDDLPRKFNGRNRIYWNDEGNGNLYYSNSTALPMPYTAVKDTFSIVDDFKIIDFNNDGFLDIVNLRSCWRGVGYYIQFLKNNKNRTFSEETTRYLKNYKFNLPNAKPYEFDWLVWIRFVDLNKDGWLDILGREQMGNSNALKWINNGTNFFQ